MGMYTEIIIKADTKRELPANVSRILHFLFNEKGNTPEDLPDHPFFRCDRWRCVGSMSSCYHHPKALSNFQEGYIFSRSDLKNYNNEIDLFFDWLDPYIDEPSGKCIGWSWYEEANQPTLITKR